MNKTEKPNILIVDDRPENLLALEKLLEGPDVSVIKATSGNDALAMTIEHEFALVLLDVQMPEMDGFETAELMRGNKETKHIPIIFVTAINKEQEHVFRGYETGAVDYLFKPLDPDILRSKVNTFLELYNQKRVLEKTNKELEKANQQILEQQKLFVEEERLKVLIQMAGAAAHELNQPLTSLLISIDLMRAHKDDPEKLSKHMDRIEGAGERISDIVKKIRTIRRDETKPYVDICSIINFDQEIRVLSVGDSDDDFEAINAIINDHNQITLSRSISIEDAVQVLKQGCFDLVLLDYILPDGDGFDFLRRMGKEGLEMPVVVITGQGDEMIASQMIQAGADDYLTKGSVSYKYLSRTIYNTLEKARLKREIKAARTKLLKVSTRDELTGLYNRRYFMESVERETSRAERYGNEMVLCMIGLDHFKTINDTHGHPAGDMALAEIGKMLTEYVRHSDLAYHYGGGECAVILPNTDTEDAGNFGERFREIVAARQFQRNSSQFRMTVSIGIASYRDGSDKSPARLIETARQALYQAKEAGRNRVVVYGKLETR
ncbi:MAG: diguanylate cyclase [Desulfobacterales bacterium]|nr:diguanylate cyclase [Desulfobacterales bacterium]